jgi:heavy metal sensor kinase
MFKSIRWTLLLWQGCILLVALASFGTVLYVAAARTADTELDASLISAARIFAVPPSLSQAAAPAPKVSSSAKIALVQRPTIWNNSAAAASDPPGSPPAGADEQNRFAAWLGSIPSDCLQRLGWDEQDQPYFIVWAADGTLLRASSSHPNSERPMMVIPAESSQQPAAQIRQRGDVREVLMAAPAGSLVQVGRSVRREQASMARLGWSIATAGAVLLALGLLGGLMLAGRALRPIRQISDTARSISVSELSQRIQIGQVKSELGSLARTLNDMFDRLEGAFVRQARFTADASHELRTPLSVIHASSQLALTRQRTAEEYRQTIESSLRASVRMNSLVESLLVLSRADADALELRYECFDLHQAAQECVGMLLPMARQRNVNVEARGQSVQIHADKEHIMQLITNLLSNAIQYNRRGGGVCISISEQQGDAVILVTDTGIGIAPTDQPRVFERFFRVDKARLRESGGCGLGLAICKSIVNAHAGSISFSSEPDVGTTFQVRLPVSPPGGNGSSV